MNMLSFYGGPAGKDFTIAKIFDSKASLDADIATGDASKIYAGDYVLVSYGDPNTPAFSTNRQKMGINPIMLPCGRKTGTMAMNIA